MASVAVCNNKHLDTSNLQERIKFKCRKYMTGANREINAEAPVKTTKYYAYLHNVLRSINAGFSVEKLFVLPVATTACANAL